MQNSSKNSLIQTNILDLTAKQTLFELAIEEFELIGPSGAKLIADIKERAAEAEYTHMYFRDPIRPGIIWFTILPNVAQTLYEAHGDDATYGSKNFTLPELPTRGRLDESRKVSESVFPGFLERVETELRANPLTAEEQVVHAQVPPLLLGTEVSGLDLVVALEYLVFVYPAMARAWAALIFVYSEILKCREGAESARQACVAQCKYAHLVGYLSGAYDSSGGSNDQEAQLIS